MEIYILSHIQPSQETRPCLDAIGSPSTYPCQWVGQSVSEWQFQIWRYIAIKWQNNPKYGNLSRIFHIYLFFLCLPLRSYGHASSNLPFRCFRWMMMFLFFFGKSWNAKEGEFHLIFWNIRNLKYLSISEKTQLVGGAWCEIRSWRRWVGLKCLNNVRFSAVHRINRDPLKTKCLPYEVFKNM